MRPVLSLAGGLFVLTLSCRESARAVAWTDTDADPSASTSPPISSAPAAASSAGGPPDDAKIALSMRRVLITQEALSFHGRNVWIDVSAGTVILRGLVVNQDERRTVIGIARATEGVVAVDDQLRVLR